jgi:amino acid transporter
LFDGGVDVNPDSQASQQDPAPSAGAPGAEPAKLRSNAVGFVGTLVQSVADIGPSASVALVVPLVALSAGNGSWLSWVLLTALLLVAAYCFSALTKRHITIGGLSGIAAGTNYPTAAFGVTIIVLFSAITTLQANVLGAALLAQSFLGTLGVGNNSAVLFVLAVILGFIGMFISYRGITFSAHMMLVFELITVVLIGLLMVVILIKQPTGVIDTDQLRLKGVSFNQIILGVVAASFALFTFECSATLGEEAKDAQKNIPRSLYGSVFFCGGLLIIASYILTLGFHGKSGNLTASTDPMNDLAKMYGVDFLKYPIAFGVAFGYFTVLVAFANWTSRLIYNLSRDGLFPKYFAAIDPKTQTPKRAIVLLGGLSLAFILVTTLINRADLPTWGYWATMAAVAYLVAYMVVTCAIGLWGLRTLKQPVLLAAGIVAAAGFAYIIFKALIPVPPYPLQLWLDLGIGVAAASFLTAFVVRFIRPELIARLGKTDRADTQRILGQASDRNG